MNEAIKRKLGKAVGNSPEEVAQEEGGSEKIEVKTRAGGKKTTGGKTAGVLKKQVQGKSQSVDTVAFAVERLGARPGEQSGFARIVERPTCGFEECGRIARARKRVRGRGGEGGGRRRGH